MEKAAKQAAKGAYKRAVFIFRRDHRLDDNTGLLWALKNSEIVYPVFVFDNRQITPDKNKFYGSNCVQFMCESLQDLESQLQGKGSHLNVLRGDYPDILVKIIDKVKPDVVCLNMDYTPYAKERDTIIEQTCKNHKVEFKSFEDITLVTTEAAKACYSGEDSFFKKFTPYYNRAVQLSVRVPEACKNNNFAKDPIQLDNSNIVSDFGKQFYNLNPKLLVRGGRTNGLNLLKKVDGLKDYANIRDDLSKTTSLLSAHNKFGTISIREVFHTTKTILGSKAEEFLRQLHWRDFYYFIGHFYSHVYTNPMNAKYSKIPWEDDPKKIQAWQTGMTGCPIVDAAMRHLNTVGWMPNRCRMIVSNYLVKDLHTNWQIGERYFASQLADFDPAQNNGGWQWSAGCGVDSQPYFRIFNPQLQMEKFDKNCEYIKKWIPELKDIPATAIHTWENSWRNYPKCTYPKPVIIHSQAKEKILEMYQASFFAIEGPKPSANDKKDDAYGNKHGAASQEPKRQKGASPDPKTKLSTSIAKNSKSATQTTLSFKKPTEKMQQEEIEEKPTQSDRQDSLELKKNSKKVKTL
jgi:deoxyribodipyrimidine photo-lyase